MKRALHPAVVTMAALLLFTANRVQAHPVTREEFARFFGDPAGVKSFDFGPADAGTLTDGIVSVAATLDENFSVDTFVPSSAIESAPGAGIRLDFSPEPGGRIWALGIDFFDSSDFLHEPSIATLTVFSTTNVLLDSFTVTSYPNPGFVGVLELPFPPFVIGHAIIRNANSPNDPFYAPLRIDNIMYVQSIRQPEPATLTLTALGLAGLVRRFRRLHPVH